MGIPGVERWAGGSVGEGPVRVGGWAGADTGLGWIVGLGGEWLGRVGLRWLVGR